MHIQLRKNLHAEKYGCTSLVDRGDLNWALLFESKNGERSWVIPYHSLISLDASWSQKNLGLWGVIELDFGTQTVTIEGYALQDLPVQIRERKVEWIKPGEVPTTAVQDTAKPMIINLEVRKQFDEP